MALAASLRLQRLVALLRTAPLPPSAAVQHRRRADAVEPAAVFISEACARRLNEVTHDSAHTGGTVLRVAVDGGGCSGFQYRFELGAAQAEDRIFERDGARVAVDPVSLGFLKGATVDYSESLIRAAFVVAENPNTEAACGCGTSFSVKEGA